MTLKPVTMNNEGGTSEVIPDNPAMAPLRGLSESVTSVCHDSSSPRSLVILADFYDFVSVSLVKPVSDSFRCFYLL